MCTVSIVIPTKNRIAQLKKLLESLQQSHFKDFEIIIVNDSPSQLPQEIQTLSYVRVLNNPQTTGLAYSRTFGAQHTKGKYVLFIDDDNHVAPDMIEKLVEALDKHTELIGIGPRTYYSSHPDIPWFLGVNINLATSKPTFYKEVTQERLLTPELFITENLHNCFMIRREMGEQVGWLDKKIFMSGTEFDLFQRIKKIYPQSKLATHLKAACYHQVPLLSVQNLRSMGFENPTRVYYFQRNRGVLCGRYGSLKDKLLLTFIFYPFFFCVYIILFLLQGKFSFIFTHIRATIAGYYYLWKKL